MSRLTYTTELAAKFCAAIADGGTLRSVCKKADMPSKASVFRWLREYPEFAKMYEIATDERADTLVDEIVDIADNCRTDADSIRKAKLRIYARVEQAQKMKPKKYGAKLQHMGEGGGPIVHKTATQMSDDELLAIAGRKESHDPDA
jgi:hypothetical protein